MNMQRMWKSTVAALTAMALFATPALAVDVPGPSVPVTATVSSALTFSVTILPIISGTLQTTPVSTMDFGTLASNGTFDPDGAGPLPPQLRTLNSIKAFQVFFGVNAQQRAFSIKQTAGPLQSGANVLPNANFIMTPLTGIGGNPNPGTGGGPLPANITVGARRSAVGTNLVVFSGTAGSTVPTLAVTYGITDDQALGATGPGIPLDQPAGSYITTITYTLTVV